jgi:hypothetical protein
MLMVLAANVGVAAFIAPAVTPLAAQRNNSSDATGVGVTGSTSVGAVFTPQTGRVEVPIADANAATGNGAVAAGAPAQARITVSVTSLQQQLEVGALRSLNGVLTSAAVQAQLRALFSPTTRVEAMNALQTALTPGTPDNPALAARFVESLGDIGGFATPRNVALAIDRLNDFIASAEPSFLASPPPALVAVHAMLQVLGADITAATGGTTTGASTPVVSPAAAAPSGRGTQR